MGDRVLHVVAAAILRDGRLLAARRPLTGRNAGKWELPGGKVELGETEEAAVIREIREELGCGVLPTSRLGEVLYEGIRLCGWSCTLVEGEPTLSEHTALCWLLPGELGGIDWAGPDIPLLGRIFA